MKITEVPARNKPFKKKINTRGARRVDARDALMRHALAAERAEGRASR